MATVAAPAVLSQPGEYDFYRCRSCGRLLVGAGIEATLAAGEGTFCPCGSKQIRPASAPWYVLCLPRVWPFAIARLRQLGWRGLVENARADAVARLLAGMARHRFHTGVPSTAAEGPVILASSQNLARILGAYVQVQHLEPDGRTTLRPLAVGALWVEPPHAPAPVEALRELR